MNLASAFAASAQKDPAKTALFFGDAEYSYGQFFTEARHVAQVLIREFQVKPGDRVALWMKNCPEFVPALFGILQAGAVVVPINNFLKPDEVNYILSDGGINVVISEASQKELIPQLTTARPQLMCLMADDAVKEALYVSLPSWTPPNRVEADLAVIIYTSGTTGRPKGAMLSHGNLLDNVESCRIVLSTVDHDRFVVVLPMFHSFMLTVGVLLPLLVNCSLLLIKSLHPAKNLLAEISRRKATILPAVPQFFRSLAAAPLPPGFPLRLCISGGAPMPIEILREFKSKVNILLIEGYGLSEASPVVSMNPLTGPQKEGSIGKPIVNVQVSVQDDGGKFLEVGVTGEICVRGGNVMMGYWNQPTETAAAIRNGWLLTGDIGHMDADGYFYITDRKKDMLLVNGINVYPREIEEIIYQYPGIKEVAVIGVPDHRRGEQPMAYVAMAEGADFDERAIIQFVRGKLADYKAPRHVVPLPALPRNATGKILKTSLRQMHKGSTLPA
jgi:long-chain acyl-CoA synthetase